MTWKEYEEFFEKIVVEVKHNTKWTEWETTELEHNCYYKTNNKKVVVKNKNYKGESSCHPSDEFDLSKGVKIAYIRMCLKRQRETLKNVINS